MMKFPTRGQTYTLRQILLELPLRDSAFLRFYPTKVRYVGSSEAGIQVIQTSALSDEHLLLDPKWENSEWTFVEETDEWIPIFRAKDDAAIEALCVIEASTESFHRNNGHMHVYPKGMQYPQYEPYDETVHASYLERVGE